MAFPGQFGHHTLALTVLPTSQGVRVRQKWRPAPPPLELIDGLRNARQRCGTLANAAAMSIYLMTSGQGRGAVGWLAASPERGVSARARFGGVNRRWLSPEDPPGAIAGEAQLHLMVPWLARLAQALVNRQPRRPPLIWSHCSASPLSCRLSRTP